MDGQRLLNVCYTKINRLAHTHNFYWEEGGGLNLRLYIIYTNFKILFYKIMS